MNVRIEIDTKTFVRFWLVVMGFALVAFAIYSARSALLIIGIAFFLAIALSPPVNKLAKILPSKSRALSTAISFLVVLVILGAVIFLIIPPIVNQTSKFIQNFPNLIDVTAHQSKGLNEFINQYHLQDQFKRALDSINNNFTQFTAGFGSFLITSIGSVLSVLTASILILVLTFFMLVEGPEWFTRLWGVYRNKQRMEHHKALISKMYKTVTSYVIGQLTVSAIAGTVAGLTIFVLSMLFSATPANLSVPAAATIFVMSLIPMFGAMIGALFVCFILMLSNVTTAVIFLGLFILYQQIEANYISPKIQSKRINLSALAILASVTIGIYLFGIIGGIISIPITGSIKILIEDYLLRQKRSHFSKEKAV